jgi:hypothetical protein
MLQSGKRNLDNKENEQFTANKRIHFDDIQFQMFTVKDFEYMLLNIPPSMECLIKDKWADELDEE